MLLNYSNGGPTENWHQKSTASFRLTTRETPLPGSVAVMRPGKSSWPSIRAGRPKTILARRELLEAEMDKGKTPRPRTARRWLVSGSKMRNAGLNRHGYISSVEPDCEAEHMI